MTAKILQFKKPLYLVKAPEDDSYSSFDLTLFNFPVVPENKEIIHKQLNFLESSKIFDVKTYFSRHGLHVENDFVIKDCLEMWSFLRFNYGQAIRLYSEDRKFCVDKNCDSLTFLEKNYCKAVADKDLNLAKAIASKLFKEPWQASFLGR